MNTHISKSLWTRIFSMCALLAASLTSLAQGFPGGPIGPLVPYTPPTPPVPQVQSVMTGTLPAQIGQTQTVTIRWYEPALFISATQAPATYFAVCALAPTQTCGYSLLATPGVWQGSASAPMFSQTPRYSGGLIGGPRIVIGYDYAFTTTINDSFFDRQLRWSVAACSSASVNACTYSIAGFNWYTTKELVGNANLQFTPSAHTLVATGQVANMGSSRIDNFSTRITAFPALASVSGRCATDPNEQGIGITNSTRMVTRDGQVFFAGDFWNGTRFDTSSIHVIGMIFGTQSFAMTAQASLNAQVPLPSQPNFVPVVARSIDTNTLPAQPGMGSSIFAMVSITEADLYGQITETNEIDNKWGECSLFFR